VARGLGWLLMAMVAILWRPASALGVTNANIKDAIEAVPWSTYLGPYLVVILAVILLSLSMLRRSRR